MAFVLIDANPVPTREIASNFNELRQDVLLLYELKLALANCEYELQTLRHRYETLTLGQVGYPSVSEALCRDGGAPTHRAVMCSNWSLG